MILDLGKPAVQRETLVAPGFVGGVPWLPPGFNPPRSVLSGVPMEFLFQVVFPAEHRLSGNSLVLFLAIDDVREDLVVPPLSCGELTREPVTEEAIARQQALHGAFLFDGADLRPSPDLLSPAEYRPLVAASWLRKHGSFGVAEARPRWIGEDETPEPLDGEQPVFCLQTEEHLEIPRRAEAPAQVMLDFFGPSGKAEREEPGYQMFAGNAVYYFAYPGQSRVVVVVQGD